MADLWSILPAILLSLLVNPIHHLLVALISPDFSDFDTKLKQQRSTVFSVMQPLLGSCIALAFSAGVCAQSDNTSQPTSFFYTRPLSQAPALNITIADGFSEGTGILPNWTNYHLTC